MLILVQALNYIKQDIDGSEGKPTITSTTHTNTNTTTTAATNTTNIATISTNPTITFWSINFAYLLQFIYNVKELSTHQYIEC